MYFQDHLKKKIPQLNGEKGEFETKWQCPKNFAGYTQIAYFPRTFEKNAVAQWRRVGLNFR